MLTFDNAVERNRTLFLRRAIFALLKAKDYRRRTFCLAALPVYLFYLFVNFV